MNEVVTIAIPALAVALAHFVWQGVLLGLLMLVLMCALPRTRPKTCYVMYCIALLVCAGLPVLNFVTALVELGTAAIPQVDHTRTASSGATMANAVLVWTGSLADSLCHTIVAIWAIGASILLMRLALSLVWIRRLRQTPQTTPQPIWQARLDRLTARFGMTRHVALRVVDGLTSPLCAGWLRPVVFIPAALLTRMTPQLIEALLAHELAHIRRHDFLVNGIQAVLEALLFYHPVIWWLSGQIRHEREQIADELAAEQIGAPRLLAHALAELSEFQAIYAPTALAQAASDGNVLTRIKRLVQPNHRHAHAGVWIQLGTLLLFGLLATAVAKLALADAEPAPRISYALVRQDGSSILGWGPDDDIDTAAAKVRAVAGDFVFVRRAGLEFVITDPAIVASLSRIWGETYVLSAELDQLDQLLDAGRTNAGLAEHRRSRLQRKRDQLFAQTERYLHRVVAPIAAAQARVQAKTKTKTKTKTETFSPPY